MKVLLLAILLNFSILNASEIKVAVCANVSYAMDSLIKKFNLKHPNIKITTILGSSGKLTAQISHGAPYDIFLSANMSYPQALYEKQKTANKPEVYALGSLALISSKKRNLSNGLNILKYKNIKKIAIANPKTAPYGKAAFQALRNAKILNDVKEKLVYGESISQTVSYAVIATDLGIIAKSSLYSDKMKKFKQNENWIEIDSKLYTPIQQGVVIVKNSKEAKLFYDFLLSEDARIIFKDYGYLLP